jgi:Rieske Fe-S protein
MSRMDRREFVTVCACAGAGMLLVGCASLVTHPVPVTGQQVRLTLSEYPELSKPDGAIKVLPTDWEDPIYVLADPTEFTAISPICTHRGCTVDVHGERLVCPCHGSTYDRQGRVLRGPAERSLTRFRVTRTGDSLTIDLGGQP